MNNSTKTIATSLKTVIAGFILVTASMLPCAAQNPGGRSRATWARRPGSSKGTATVASGALVLAARRSASTEFVADGAPKFCTCAITRSAPFVSAVWLTSDTAKSVPPMLTDSVLFVSLNSAITFAGSATA